MTLKEWLQSSEKPYNIGVQLFKQIGGSTVLLNVFLAAETNSNRAKLYQKLLEFYKASDAPRPKPFTPAPALPQPSGNIAQELTPIYQTKLGAFKKMAALHQELCNIKGNSPKAIASRFQLQLQILRLNELNEECWGKIHYFEKHGKLPSAEDDFSIDTLSIRELVNYEKTIPSYITKFNKELAEPNLPEDRRTDLIKRKADWQIKGQKIRQAIDELPSYKKVKEALC